MSRIPKRYTKFMEDYPAVGEAYKALGHATMNAGPLDEKTRELVKMAVSLGARMESATKSHFRRAREAGATIEEVKHAVLLATTTVGFPNMMTAMSWVESEIERESEGG